MVRRHAEEVLHSVLKNDSVNADSIARMSEEDKAALRRRLDTADKVMERISKAHAADNAATELAFEEYQEVRHGRSVLPTCLRAVHRCRSSCVFSGVLHCYFSKPSLLGSRLLAVEGLHLLQWAGARQHAACES